MENGAESQNFLSVNTRSIRSHWAYAAVRSKYNWSKVPVTITILKLSLNLLAYLIFVLKSFPFTYVIAYIFCFKQNMCKQDAYETKVFPQ